jgi:hypothetical protein
VSSTRNSLSVKSLNRETSIFNRRRVCEIGAGDREGLGEGEKASRKVTQYEQYVEFCLIL